MSIQGSSLQVLLEKALIELAAKMEAISSLNGCN